MSQRVIEVESLWKRYRLGAIGSGIFIRDLESWWARLRGKPDPNAAVAIRRENRETTDGYFWALQDLNFTVDQGEILGVIGKNGSGKSTLLKILSRVTTPTAGEVRLRGRVASLLEVGTGFHPELTGRENIYLNGSILGMKRHEIASSFDDIVDFAGIGAFIDTPVKRYSSGMSVRLAFSVAAHLRAEILLTDEVLAVGDYDFQKKCVNKMRDVAHEGRTVLFVSHNIGAIHALCTRAILLNNGTHVASGTPLTMIERYLTMDLVQTGERAWPTADKSPWLGHDAFLAAVRIVDSGGATRSVFDVKESLVVQIEFVVVVQSKVLLAEIQLKGETSETVFASMDNLDSPWRGQPPPPGRYRHSCTIPANLLSEGAYRIDVALRTRPPSELSIEESDVVSFTMSDDRGEDGVRGDYGEEWPATMLRPRLHWECVRADLSEVERIDLAEIHR